MTARNVGLSEFIFGPQAIFTKTNEGRWHSFFTFFIAPKRDGYAFYIVHRKKPDQSVSGATSLSHICQHILSIFNKHIETKQVEETCPKQEVHIFNMYINTSIKERELLQTT